MITTKISCSCNEVVPITANFCTSCGLALDWIVDIDGGGTGPIFKWQDYNPTHPDSPNTSDDPSLPKSKNISDYYDMPEALPLWKSLGLPRGTNITDWVQNAETVIAHIPEAQSSRIVFFDLTEMRPSSEESDTVPAVKTYQISDLDAIDKWVEPILCGMSTLYQVLTDQVIGFDLSGSEPSRHVWETPNGYEIYGGTIDDDGGVWVLAGRSGHALELFYQHASLEKRHPALVLKAHFPAFEVVGDIGHIHIAAHTSPQGFVVNILGLNKELCWVERTNRRGMKKTEATYDPRKFDDRSERDLGFLRSASLRNIMMRKSQSTVTFGVSCLKNKKAVFVPFGENGVPRFIANDIKEKEAPTWVIGYEGWVYFGKIPGTISSLQIKFGDYVAAAIYQDKVIVTHSMRLNAQEEQFTYAECLVAGGRFVQVRSIVQNNFSSARRLPPLMFEKGAMVSLEEYEGDKKLIFFLHSKVTV